MGFSCSVIISTRAYLVKPENDKSQTLKFRYIYFLNASFDLIYHFLSATLWNQAAVILCQIGSTNFAFLVWNRGIQIQSRLWKKVKLVADKGGREKYEKRIPHINYSSLKEGARAQRMGPQTNTQIWKRVGFPFDLRGFAEQVVSFHLYSKDVNLLAHSIFRSITRATVKLVTLFRNGCFILLPKNVFLFGELMSPCVNK